MWVVGREDRGLPKRNRLELLTQVLIDHRLRYPYQSYATRLWKMELRGEGKAEVPDSHLPTDRRDTNVRLSVLPEDLMEVDKVEKYASLQYQLLAVLKRFSAQESKQTIWRA
ncbi:hypothetical protein R1flu_026755 [Riccia fluitans]|uniref:Uncharacterized protein n=1 Tax=Riccia fluitans TaxID=41844 RepID=A0ABD1XGU2_9MARC